MFEGPLNILCKSVNRTLVRRLLPSSSRSITTRSAPNLNIALLGFIRTPRFSFKNSQKIGRNSCRNYHKPRRYRRASEIMSESKNLVGKYDDKRPIVWIDCEMTGLDHLHDHIIQICCLITDKNLNLLDDKGYESVIHCPKSTMDKMDEWCTQHHGSSGLTAEVIASNKTKEQVDKELLEYLKRFMSKGTGILAGNSVHVDRLFLLRELPNVVDYLTYRIIDVSSVMEFAKRHNPTVERLMPPKIGVHTAKQDIIESINQMKFYRDVYFKNEDEIDVKAVRREWKGKDINGNRID